MSSYSLQSLTAEICTRYMYSVRSKHPLLDMKPETKGFVPNGGVYNLLNNEFNHAI